MIELTASQMYLEQKATAVLDVDSIQDDYSACLPVYYTEIDGRLYTSTSVFALVDRRGRWEPDSRWQYITRNHPKKWISQYTADKHVHRLATFHKKVRGEPAVEVVNLPTEVHPSIEQFYRLAATAITGYVREIEERFGDSVAHLVFAGGHDSRLILAVPKLSPANWHALSVGKTARLTADWLEKNGIEFGSFTAQPVKTAARNMGKWTIAGDCAYRDSYSAGCWGEMALQMAEKIGKRLICWGGFGAIVFHPGPSKPYCRHNWRNFYTLMGTKAALGAGTYAQSIFNYSGFPMLDPYVAPTMWANVLHRYHIRTIGQTDRREKILKLASGRDLSFGENVQLEAGWVWTPQHFLENYCEELGKIGHE